MSRTLLALSLAAALQAAAPSWAQVEDGQEAEAGGASQQVEESDEAFRRRMELEDARQRDTTYVDAQAGYKRELEKIDRLPEASRDHIREQLIDVIMENGEWTPDDARRDYPYTPSAAARDDAGLAQQEQEAWDEQIEKYHAREAAAFGALRPAQGAGAEGADGAAGAGSGGAEGRAGENASGSSADSSATYEPYEAARRDDEERASTAGVSQSALDFILGRSGAQQAPPSPAESAGSPAGPDMPASPTTPASPAETAATQASTASDAPENDAEAEAEDAPRDLRGILAIEDLDKLGDAVRPPPPPEEEPDTTPPDDG